MPPCGMIGAFQPSLIVARYEPAPDAVTCVVSRNEVDPIGATVEETFGILTNNFCEVPDWVWRIRDVAPLRTQLVKTPGLRVVRFGLACGIAVLATGVLAGPASAHPLGNFTTNRYSGVTVGPGRGTVDYVLDLAEIPTFQQRATVDTNGDGRYDDAELRAAAAPRCSELQRGLQLVIGDRAIPLVQRSALMRTLPGQGLVTLRVECRFDWSGADRSAALHYRDTNFAGRVGWRELIAVGDQTTLHSSNVPTTSLSKHLTNYPKNQLRSPLDAQAISLHYQPGGAAAPQIRSNPLTSRYEGLTGWFTHSVESKRLTLGLAMLAVAAALILGAFHALFPGHGKTVMAAYMVGQRGSTRQGFMLGLTVAITHTIGVLVLGIVLTATQTFAPESVYPYLGVFSGILFGALGVTLLVRAVRQRKTLFAHGHSHGGHTHSHDHHAHEHAAHEHEHHGHEHDYTVNEDAVAPLRTRSLVALGFAGGLVPTPSAVIVLLGATAIGRAWFGVMLVVFYGVGMSATLIAAGLALGWARRRFSLERASQRALRIAASLPIVTGIVVTGGGLLLIGRALGSA